MCQSTRDSSFKTFTLRRGYTVAPEFSRSTRAHLTEETPGAGRQAGRLLLAAWAPYLDHNQLVVVEKSPPIRTRFLQAAFPDACFVLVVWHPAIVALRTQRFRPGQGHGLVELIRHWTRAHDIFASDRPLLRNACVVWYEAFVDDPSAVLADVASRVGITAEFDISRVDASRSDGVFDHWLSIRPTIDAIVLQKLANDVSRHGYLLDCPRPVALPAGDGD